MTVIAVAPFYTKPKVEITIDPDFQTLVAPLSADEFQLLESQILSQGCLTPLIVWKTDNGQRILLDGHNRHEICTKHNRTFQTVNVKLADREHAKLHILEHQAGRRNLTDDQRAIVWNEIREQRSRLAKKQRAIQASAALHGLSVKIDDKPLGKKDTRAAVAKEAKLPENKLKQAQTLKKYQPALYAKVRAGEVKLRDTSKLFKKTAAEDLRKRYSEKDFYRRVGQALGNLYRTNQLDERLGELMKIKKSDWDSAAKKGFPRLLGNLTEIRKQTDAYIKAFQRIVKANK